jgi:hypothetical protein
MAVGLYLGHLLVTLVDPKGEGLVATVAERLWRRSSSPDENWLGTGLLQFLSTMVPTAVVLNTGSHNSNGLQKMVSALLILTKWSPLQWSKARGLICGGPENNGLNCSGVKHSFQKCCGVTFNNTFYIHCALCLKIQY